MKNILIILIISLFSNFSMASGTASTEGPYFCLSALDDLPIQQDGRVKPLYVHAKETIKYLLGKKKFQGYSAVQVYCLLSLESLALENKLHLKARVDHIDLKKYLKFSTEQKTISFKDLIEKKDELILEWRSAKQFSSYKKSANKLLSKLSIYEDISSGKNWTLPVFTQSKDSQKATVTWSPIKTFLTKEMVISQEASLLSRLQKVKDQYKKQDNSSLYIELKMVKWRLPTLALLLSLIALATMVLSPRFGLTLTFSILTILIQTLYMTLRTIVSGRAPITNMYETVLFSGYAALVIALIVGHLKNEKQYITMGLIYNFLTLMMINFAGFMLSSTISPLVPVLRDNFWLSTHVTSIIISYGALALSWILANVILIKHYFNKLTAKDLSSSSEQIYSCLIYGTILLAIGIILGGIWADYSWGRFWGWDPKETWSLIVLCIYIAILHGKYTSWIPKERFVPLVAAAFLSVMMAWFGVNYILASGLHSYGFSQGGAVFLGTFFAIQILVIIITAPKLLKINSGKGPKL